MPPPIITLIPVAIIAIIVFLIGSLIWQKLHENENLKYEFITIITHKFRTPLTLIKWTLEDLVKNEPDSFRRQSLLQVQRSNEDLVKMIAALIESIEGQNSKKASYKFEKVDLIAMVRESFSLTERSFKEKNISVSFNFASREIFIKADQSRIEFVLSTILENAYTYTPTGRIVSVAVGTKRNNAIISVTDDGIGIDKWEMPHISTKFFRSKEAKAMDTDGFGVNLYLSRAIINRHHGKLDIYSAGLKKGSTFSVILPLAR